MSRLDQMLVERGRIAYRAPVLLAIPARTIHAFHWAPESAGWVLTLSDTYLDDMFAREAGFRALFEEPDRFEFAEGGAEMALFEFELGRLARELNWTAPGHAAAVEAHLQAVLVEAMRLMQSARGRSQVAPGPHAEIVARFRVAVEQQFRRNLPLDAYAQMLGVSPSRLRAACLKVAEQPPARLVQERRLLEARRMLLASDLPVSRPAVSQHLRVLKEAGLVSDRADGTRRIYQVQPQGVQAIHTYLDQMWGQALASFQAAAVRAAAATDDERQKQP